MKDCMVNSITLLQHAFSSIVPLPLFSTIVLVFSLYILLLFPYLLTFGIY